MRLFGAIVVVMTWLASGQVYAQATLNKPDCTKANIDSTEEKISKMADGPRKATATSELALARRTLEAGQIQECQDHLLKADVQTK